MKKLYIKIDEQGYFFADELITDLTNLKEKEETLLQNYIDPNTNPIPSGIHLPKWNGTNWVEGKELNIEEEKSKALKEIKKLTKLTIENGIQFKGHSFLLRQIPDQLNLNTTFNQLNLNNQKLELNQKIQWKTKDGTIIYMSAQTFKEFYSKAADHVSEILKRSKYYQQRIQDTEEIDQVEEIMTKFKEVQDVGK